MRAEVPDDAHVGLVQAEVHAARRDEVDLAELAGVDQALDRRHRRAVEERVAGHSTRPFASATLDQLARLLGRRRERLLDEDVLAGLERRHRERVVGRDGRRDRDRLDRLVAAARPRSRVVQANAGVAPCERLERLRPRGRRRRRARSRRRRRGCERGSGPSSRGRRRRCADRRRRREPARLPPSAGLPLSEDQRAVSAAAAGGRARATSRGRTRRRGRAPRRRSSAPAPRPARARSARPGRGSARSGAARRARARTGSAGAGRRATCRRAGR